MNRLCLKKIYFLFILIATSYPSLLNAQRGLRVVNAQNGETVVDSQGAQQILYRQSYALLIGVSDYTAGWPDLPGVREDIAAVEKVLKQHNFTVTKVSDPDRKKLDVALEKFINDYGLDEGNRLLIYFAGHGYTIKKKYGGEMGYIVPVDAPNPHVDNKGFLRKAMSIEEFGLFARRIDSKHAIFIFDSCFAGSIFPKTRAIPASISDKTSNPVRQFITSGSADEEVPDVSVFRQHLVDALSGEGDSNNDGYITGSELGLFLEDKVVNDSNNTQHPQYGKIRDSRLNKGDFVFILPQKKSSMEAARKDNRTTGGSKQAELMFWDTIKNSSNPADFRAYLTRYPYGEFAPLAKIRSGQSNTPDTSKTAEIREQKEARKRAEPARIAREQEEERKKAEAARIAREQEEARKRAEAARIAREQEEERTRAEAAYARKQNDMRKRAEPAPITREQGEKRTEKKKRRIISTF
jgi:uncharacterized caspase-like protein